MRQEVDSIRRLLQFELAGLMSDSKKREEPVRAMIYELLLSSGFENTFHKNYLKILMLMLRLILLGDS